MIRAVLDTNVAVSALLFSATITTYFCLAIRPASPCRIRSYPRRIYPRPRLSRIQADEYRNTRAEIRGLREEELIPFIETVTAVPTNIPDLRDPDDAKFIACAVATGVRWLVSGDDDLLSLHHVESVDILSVTAFLQQLKRRS